MESLSKSFRLSLNMLILLGLLLLIEATESANLTTYLVEDDHAIFNHLFKSLRSETLSTIPMCYTDPANEGDDGSVKVSNMTMEEYLDRVNRTKIPPITITLVPEILQLVDLDEKSQKVTMVIAVHKLWQDCRLSWTSKISPLEEITVATASFRKLNVFTPPVRLLEALNPKENADSETKVTVFNDGSVYVTEEFSTEFSCNIDVRMFPFDYQICYLTFESVLAEDYARMTYTRSSILAESKFFIGRYTPSDQWSLTMLPPVLSNRDSCFNRNEDYCLHSGLKYKLFLRRNPDYQLINLLFPAFLIVAISSCVFIVPPGGGDKMGLCVSILLSLFMFSELMYDKMPETGSVPLLSEYFLVCIVLVSVSCIYSSISSVFASASPRLPHCLHRFVSLVGPYLIFDMVKAAPTRSKSACVECKCKSKKAAAAREADEQGESAAEEATDAELMDAFGVADEQQQPGFRMDQPEKLPWAALGALLDRVFFILHLGATVCVLLVYLLNGYAPWSGYTGLKLSNKDMDYVCAQLHIQDDLQSDLDCPEIYSNYKHEHEAKQDA